jgi:predicted TIM-barrel fold metal-dependent hydrolase
MASAGIAAAIIGPTAVGSPQARGILDTRDQNAVISRACRQYPGRFPIGLALIEIRHGSAGVEALERELTENGLMGVMWHPGGVSPERRLYPFLEVAAMGKGLCLLHETPARTASFARRFPDLTFIQHAEAEAVEVCRGLENVWFEIVQVPKGAGSKWNFSGLINQMGNERLMFGGDAPYYDYRILQAELESANIDDESRDRIACHNAVTLIQQFRPDWELPAERLSPPRIYTEAELWTAEDNRLRLVDAF